MDVGDGEGVDVWLPLCVIVPLKVQDAERLSLGVLEPDFVVLLV